MKCHIPPRDDQLPFEFTLISGDIYNPGQSDILEQITLFPASFTG
jgi:hypothetical protein